MKGIAKKLLRKGLGWLKREIMQEILEELEKRREPPPGPAR